MGNNEDFWGDMLVPLLIAGGFTLGAVALGIMLVACGGGL